MQGEGQKQWANVREVERQWARPVALSTYNNQKRTQEQEAQGQYCLPDDNGVSLRVECHTMRKGQIKGSMKGKGQRQRAGSESRCLYLQGDGIPLGDGALQI